jgi:hypothetical protein
MQYANIENTPDPDHGIQKTVLEEVTFISKKESIVLGDCIDHLCRES